MPFIKTAYLGSSGAPVLPKEEYINHFGLIRIRVTGSGVLRPTFYSMDDVNSSTLPTITMAANTNRIPESKSNFKEQRVSLKLATTAIDEKFKISKIDFFVRPLWASFPG